MSFDPSQMPPKPHDGGLSSDDRLWGMLAHLSPLLLGFVGPLVIWLVYKEKSNFIADQAKEALNFQLTVMIAAVILAATIIGIILIPLIAIAVLVFEIIAGMEANKGVWYRYPYTIRMIS